MHLSVIVSIYNNQPLLCKETDQNFFLALTYFQKTLSMEQSIAICLAAVVAAAAAAATIVYIRLAPVPAAATAHRPPTSYLYG